MSDCPNDTVISDAVIKEIKDLIEPALNDATPWLIGLGVIAAVMSAFVFISLIVLVYMNCKNVTRGKPITKSASRGDNKNFNYQLLNANDDYAVRLHDDYFNGSHYDKPNKKQHRRTKSVDEERNKTNSMMNNSMMNNSINKSMYSRRQEKTRDELNQFL